MRRLLYCCLVLSLAACKEKYDAPVNVPTTGYLVVEGFISANGPAQLRLSRTIPLSDTAHYITETSAVVKVQGNDNSSYNLTETSVGVYANSLLNLNKNQQYRLYIKTREGKEYLSDYVAVRTVPAIDTVQWATDNNGLQISLSTHDPNNNTWYYRWETAETWEFHSNYYTVLTFNTDATGNIKGVKYRRSDHGAELSLYTCWQYENSSNILLGSSAKLSRDSISYPLVYIPKDSWKVGILYSLNVKQYALSKAEYEYLLKMKQNSEATGSIFSRQPSELAGNIHCTTNAEEPVIGYIGIANVQEKRIFIRPGELPGWHYFLDCESREIPSDSAAFYTYYEPVSPTEVANGKITKYLGAQRVCVLCTLRGNNIKPSYWP